MLSLLILAICHLASAQDVPDLATALNSTEELSILNVVLGQYPDLLAKFAALQDMSIFAPSNDALAPLMEEGSSTAAQAMVPGVIEALLRTHVVSRRVAAEDISTTPIFPSTLLDNQTFTQISGGQRIKVWTQDDGAAVVSSGVGGANITTADVALTNGTMHIIDAIIDIPRNLSDTLAASGLTAFALELEGSADSLLSGTAGNLTVFAPSNAAFGAIGRTWDDALSANQKAENLRYHFVDDVVAYSNLIGDGTRLGELDVTVEEGAFFVNSARVTAVDIIFSRGVIHVLDTVLNPDNTTGAPEPENNEGTPAYSMPEPGELRAVASQSMSLDPAETTLATALRVLDGYNVVPTSSSTSVSPGSTGQDGPDNSSSSSLSTGAKAGIGVGVSLVALLAVGAIIFYFRRKKVAHPPMRMLDTSYEGKPELSGEGVPRHELGADAQVYEKSGDARLAELDGGHRAELPAER